MNRSLLIRIFLALTLFFMTQQLYACKTTPTAKIVSPDDPHYVLEGSYVSFDGEGSDSETPPTGSYDGDNGPPNGGGNGIDKYEWHYGDEEPGEDYWNDDGGTPSHQYNDAGAYVVYLKVTDDDDPAQTDTTESSETVTINVMKVEIYDPEPSEFPKNIGVDSSLTLKARIIPSSATGGEFNWSQVSGPPNAATLLPDDEYYTSFSADTVGSYTVKVEYTIGGVTCSDTSGTIQVHNAKMFFKAGTPPIETSSITRAESGTFEVLDPLHKQPILLATYSDWAFHSPGGLGVDVSDPDNTSNTWSGTIVQPGKASCTVNFGGGITCEVNKEITVNARSGWSITPDCKEDNEPDWVHPDDPYGGFPMAPPGWAPGGFRNIDNKNYVITPRGPGWQDGYTTAKVNSGPNKDVWYIESSSFVIDMETVINKYVKPGTSPPNPPGTNFYEKNQSEGVNAAAFFQACKNHEYKGTGGNGHGHFAYLEVEEAKPFHDVKESIESIVEDSENKLKNTTAIQILIIDSDLWSHGEPPDGSNWSGRIWVFDWDGSPQEWVPIDDLKF